MNDSVYPSKPLMGLALGVAGLCVVLLALRVGLASSFTEPLQVQTSGAEYESLYAIWKYTDGRPVYNDRYQPPYNAAMFNWLFYQAYGAVTKTVLHGFGLADAWLPTVARFFTLFGVALGTALAYSVFSHALGPGLPRRNTLALAHALAAMAGPLVGFWAFTVRPDVWALVSEIAGTWWFLKHYPRKRLAALAGAAVAAYAAWAFKQGSVNFLITIGLFLLWRRAWRDLAVIVLAMAAAFALTFALGAPQYLNNILFSGYPLDFAAERGMRNIGSFVVKSTPALLLFAGASFYRWRSRTPWSGLLADDTVLFSGLGVAVSGLFAFPLSFQVGGSENYFFSFAFFVALAAMALVPRHADGPGLGGVVRFAITGWLIMGAALATVLLGRVGVIDISAQHRHLMAIKNCVDPLERPIYVEDDYSSLPWMTSAEEHFVLSYVYKKERARGRDFTGGGIGGYVRRGDFRTLVLVGEQAPERLDGASLENYRAVTATCNGYTVLVRRENG